MILRNCLLPKAESLAPTGSLRCIQGVTLKRKVLGQLEKTTSLGPEVGRFFCCLSTVTGWGMDPVYVHLLHVLWEFKTKFLHLVMLDKCLHCLTSYLLITPHKRKHIFEQWKTTPPFHSIQPWLINHTKSWLHPWNLTWRWKITIFIGNTSSFMEDFPASHVSFSGVYTCYFQKQNGT